MRCHVGMIWKSVQSCLVNRNIKCFLKVMLIPFDPYWFPVPLTLIPIVLLYVDVF